MNKITPGKLWPEVAPDWIWGLPQNIQDLCYDFYKSLVFDNRYEMYFTGLKNTLLLTMGALMIGIILGVIVALIRVTWDKNGREMKGLPQFVMWLANKICVIYLTIIRGTPAVVQLMIMYYVIFASSRNKVLIAAMSFGINSGVDVAEIIRGGIQSVDGGQMEAGRSLGFGYVPTMRYIVLPQAFKNVLPNLANEFIVLLKETSVAGYVGVTDLTYAGNIVGGISYEYLFPLLVTACIYLIMVMFFTFLVGKLERRLRSSER